MEGKPKERREIEFYFWIHHAVRKYVEIIMDLILIGLLGVTFILIAKSIYLLWLSLYQETDIHKTLSEIMFIFILIEVVRLLILYLEFHKVALDAIIEIAIASALRELILKGILEVEPLVLVVASLFILVLGLFLRFGDIRHIPGEVFTRYRPFFKRKEPHPHKGSLP